MIRKLAISLLAVTAAMQAHAAPPMVVVDEQDLISEEAPPHGKIGMSTAYRISDISPDRTMEFRKRSLHPGSAIGEHVIAHDEVYYVVSGKGIVSSDGETAELTEGMSAYLYDGANVGIDQVGEEPLVLIIAYPLPGHERLISDSKDYDRFIVDVDRQPDETLQIWPDGPPDDTAQELNQHYVERDNRFGLPDRAVHEVTSPTLSVFHAKKPNGDAILLIPGGGYNHVVVEKEGYEGARYFNQFGYDVYVMDYRLPHQGWTAGPDTPLQDAQRAMRLVRQLQSENDIDGDEIVMGFSAGGHLAGSLTQRYEAKVYEGSDQADTLSARPDKSVLVYPVALMGTDTAHKGSQIRLLGETPDEAALDAYDLTTAPNPEGPPVFLLHALDDTSVPVENSLELALAYRAAGIPAVLHIFENGGHGFGLRGIEETPLATWPKLVMDWIEQAED